jgi:hypothetical protein
MPSDRRRDKQYSIDSGISNPTFTSKGSIAIRSQTTLDYGIRDADIKTKVDVFVVCRVQNKGTGCSLPGGTASNILRFRSPKYRIGTRKSWKREVIRAAHAALISSQCANFSNLGFSLDASLWHTKN